VNTSAPTEQTWWLLDYYNERSRLLTRVRVQARLPATAAAIGAQQLLAAHPAASRRTRQTLLRRAESNDRLPDGWVLYRIATES